MSDTPTPRTDAAELDGREFYRGSSGPSGYCDADFARDLERQLAELTDRWERAANAYLIERGKHEETQRQLAEATAWRPIETAPQTGEMLVCCNRTPSCDHYKSDIYHAWRDQEKLSGWARWPHDFPPTHWQPLPNAPTA